MLLKISIYSLGNVSKKCPQFKFIEAHQNIECQVLDMR